jgi:transcriptional regulator with XRE-family HTH domain
VLFDQDVRGEIAGRFARGEPASRLVLEYGIDNSILNEITADHDLNEELPGGYSHRRRGPRLAGVPVVRLADPDVYLLVPGLVESLERIADLETRLRAVQRLVDDTYFMSPRGNMVRAQLTYVLRFLRERHHWYAADLESRVGAPHAGFVTAVLTERDLPHGGHPPGLEIPDQPTEEWALDTATRLSREYSGLTDSWIVARAIRRDLVVAMVDSGYWTVVDVAGVAGMSVGVARGLQQGMVRSGRRSPASDVLDAHAETVLAAAQAGATQQALAQHYGVSANAIKLWFQLNGDQWPHERGTRQAEFTAAEALAAVPELVPWLHAGVRAEGLSQTRLGERIGVPRTTVSMWMRGEAVPSRDRLRRLEMIFGVLAPENAWQYLPDLPLRPVHEVAGEERYTHNSGRGLGGGAELAGWIREFEDGGERAGAPLQRRA